MKLSTSVSMSEEFGNQPGQFSPTLHLPEIKIAREKAYNDQWVMRINNKIIDRDTFRNDLLERFQAKVKISVDI